MIDPNARNKLFNIKQNAEFLKTLSQVKPQEGNPNKFTVEYEETSDPQSINLLWGIKDALGAILGALKALRFNLPNIFKVTGTVSVDRVTQLPPIEVRNLHELSQNFSTLGTMITAQAQQTIKAIQAVKLNSPDSVSLNNESLKIEGIDEMLDSLEEVKKGFNLLLKKDFGNPANGPMQVEIVKEPVRMTPQPVTNININALRGVVKTTAATVGTSLTTLPSYGQLEARRAVVVYNNSSNTIFIGGSDVTAANGIPVAANSYSNIIDAGYNMVVYAIASTTGNNVRVMEVSNDISGNIQE